MNNKQSKKALSNEASLKEENEALRKKLAEEFGMMKSDTSSLNDDEENQWLNYICDFENFHKNSKQIKLYEFIGSPEFKPFENIHDEEIDEELDRLFEIMAKNNIVLDVLCEYESSVLYEFVTKELFNHEVNDFRLTGLITHFCYEEFHPNHEYDLKSQTEDFLKSVLKRTWDSKFDAMYLCDSVSLNGKHQSKEEISTRIIDFQHNNVLKLLEVKINSVTVDMDKKSGLVIGKNLYLSGINLHERDFELCFIYNGFFWEISQISLTELI